MARYRKIDTRMWGDSRFRKLSSPNPSGKYLWIFLLTGPHTSNIPGLFRAGEMALAEELEWGLEGFREGFREAFQEGLVKADWKARVVWVPNAIKYNAPESPNVVKSWRTAWDEIPECALKVEAYERLKAFTEGLGEGFAKAFAEGCPKGLANQEQEQEQEQEQKKPSSSELKNSSDVMTGRILEGGKDFEPEKKPVSSKAPISKEAKPKHIPSAEAVELAALLKARILENNPSAVIKDKDWVLEADRMMRLDHRSADESRELLIWCQSHSFWMSNILCMDTFRRQFDKLKLQKQNGSNGRGYNKAQQRTANNLAALNAAFPVDR